MSVGIVSYSFKSPQPTDGTGNVVNTAVPIPTMRGRQNADPKWVIAELKDVLETMAGGNCTFWACRGPNYPRHMITCSKCWSMRQLASVIRSLERKMEVKDESRNCKDLD